MKGALYMTLSALSFSLMSLFVKELGTTLSLEMIILGRAVIGIALTAVMLRKANVAWLGSNRPMLLLRGLLGFGGLVCFFYAVTQLPLAEATLLHHTNPIFTALFASLFLAEVAGLQLWFSLLLSLTGVWLTSQPQLFANPADNLSMLSEYGALPLAAAVLGAIFAGAAYTTVRHLSKTEHPLVIVLYFPLVALPLGLLFAYSSLRWPTPREALLLLGMGSFMQAGQITLTYGLKLLPAGQATAMSYQQVLFAGMWGFLLFNERPHMGSILGGVLIFCGTLLVVSRHAKQASVRGATAG